MGKRSPTLITRDVYVSKRIQGKVTLFKSERPLVKSSIILRAVAYNTDVKSSLLLYYAYLQLVSLIFSLDVVTLNGWQQLSKCQLLVKGQWWPSASLHQCDMLGGFFAQTYVHFCF